MTAKKPTETRKKSAPKPKPTDVERHARFVETAKKVQASEKPEDFDKAFEKVVDSNRN